MDDMKDKFANNLRRLMKIQGLTVQQVADIAHTDRQSVYAWLNGGGVTDARLTKLAEHFETTKSELRYGSGDINTELLAQILAQIERAEKQSGGELEPIKRAKLIGILYERYWMDGNVPDDDVVALLALTA